MATTSRWALRYPVGADAADVPLWMLRLATDLDVVAMDDQGTLAARPVSTGGSPGKRGRYYKSTDDNRMWRDHGTGWDEIPFVPVGTADIEDLAVTNGKIAANTIVASAKISPASITNPEYQDNSINNAKISSSAAIVETKLSLATDAAAGTGSRRTLGTGATQAAAGNDSRFPAGADIVGGDVATSTLSDSHIAASNKDGAAGTPCLRTLGTSAAQAAAGNDARFTKTFRLGHSFAVAGEIRIPVGNLDVVPAIFIPVASGKTATLVQIRHRIGAGTSVTYKIQRNAVDLYTGHTVETTAELIDVTDQALTDGDVLQLIVTGVSGTPQNLSVTLILEHTI